MTGHDFSWALAQIRAGKNVTRSGWNGPGQWVHKVGPQNEHHAPHCCLRNAQGKHVPWVPSQGDLFADDWRLA